MSAVTCMTEICMYKYCFCIKLKKDFKFRAAVYSLWSNEIARSFDLEQHKSLLLLKIQAVYLVLLIGKSVTVHTCAQCVPLRAASNKPQRLESCLTNMQVLYSPKATSQNDQ